MEKIRFCSVQETSQHFQPLQRNLFLKALNKLLLNNNILLIFYNFSYNLVLNSTANSFDNYIL